VPLPVLLAALALLAGCGGDGGDGNQSPKERLEAVLPDYERAVGTQDCAAFARFAHSQVRAAGRTVDDPPDAAECRNLGFSYTRLLDFEADRTKLFGTAALVEGNLAGRLTALVWVLDVDGRWKQVQATPPSINPQIQGQPRPENRFARNAADWVTAMRAGDCRRVFRLLNPASPFLADEGREQEGAFCARFRRSAREPERLPAQLRQAPTAKAVDMGGTRDFHFLRLDTGRGRHWTVIMSSLAPPQPPPGHELDAVLDYYRTAPPPNGNGEQ
jgi:hypothetical protein